MLSLSERALGSSSSNQDNVTFLTSVAYLQPLRQDNCSAFVKETQDVMASSSTRLQGLNMLELALRQNFDIYDKAKWSDVLIEFLKEPISTDCKEKVCSIFNVIIDYWAKDPVGNKENMMKLHLSLCPLLIDIANGNFEWKESAFQCLVAIVKGFPSTLVKHEESIQKLIVKQTNSVSSKSFEAFAECYSYLPAVQRTSSPEYYKDSWICQYKFTLNTMNALLNNILTYISEDEKVQIPNSEYYEYDFKPKDDFENRMIAVRQFINFSRCLATLLSTKSKHPVQVPIQQTLDCIGRLFAIEKIAGLSATSMENQILLSSLCQLQIAALALLEPILTNFGNHVVPFTGFICDLLKLALRASHLPNISRKPISQIRHVVWKLLKVWLGSQSAKGAAFKIIEQATIIKELLHDISIQEKPPEMPVPQPQGKSKKNAVVVDVSNNNYVNENWYVLCKEALKALKRILYGGGCFLDKKMFQEILSKVVVIAYAIHPSADIPFPYTNEACRKNLYDVLLALTVIAKPSQIDTLQHTIVIFENAKQDSSNKVTSVCCKAAATCRFALHPKKPPIRDTEGNQNLVPATSLVGRFAEFSRDDIYIENLPPVEEDVPEEPDQVDQAYPSDNEMPAEDYAQADDNYSEHEDDNQCNGEEVLEIQNASQSQEDEEESEEEGDADEYEDEERSFDEEMNEEVDLQPDHMYIPNTGELQELNPAIIAPENEHSVNLQPEYEELRPSENKVQDNALGTIISKSMHMNGVHNSVPDEAIASVSTDNNVPNINGIYSCEYEVEEEEEDEEEAVEEEASAHYPAEKRVPEFIETPAAKKQKVDVDDEINRDEDEETDQRSKSPTLEEMKADFIFGDGEGMKS